MKKLYLLAVSVSAFIVFLMPYKASAATTNITDFAPLPDATMYDTTWGTGVLSNDYMRSHQDAWGQNPKNVSSGTPLALAVLVSRAQILATVNGVSTKVCEYDTYTFYWGSYMRWTTDSTGKHHLQRTVGYNPDGTAITGFKANGFTEASKWPYHDDTLGSQDTFMYMNTIMKGNIANFNGWEVSQCEGQIGDGYKGIDRFNGTPSTAMQWTDILSTFDPEKVPGTGQHYGIVYSQNVTYDPSYTGRKNFNLTAPEGQDASGCIESGGLLGFSACKLKEIMGDIFSPMWDGVLWLMVPNEQDINDRVGALQNFFSDKLGFLLYPFEFVIQLFAVFTTPPNNWCNNTACVINAGQVYGTGNLTIDIMAIKNVSNAAWTLITTLLRAGLVLALIAGIHRKFEEVTQK